MSLSSPHQQAPESNPALSGIQIGRLDEAVRDLTGPQLAWASGYLAGLAIRPRRTFPDALPQPGLLVLYGSQTGNAAGVAKAVAQTAGVQGLEPRVLSTAELRPRDLAKERLLLLVTSTHGEGEPPEAAVALHRFLHSERAPRLDRLAYAVLGLGDSSYAHFCQAARHFDQRLHALGARRLLPLAEADLDFEPVVANWTQVALKEVSKLAPRPTARVLSLHVTAASHPSYTRANPYAATVVESRRLTTDDAAVEVRHLALEVEPGALGFAPGDSLGVRFRNDPDLIADILRTLGIERETPVIAGENETSISQALAAGLEITQIHPKVIRGWAELGGDPALSELVADEERLRAYIGSHQIVDLIQGYPARIEAAAFAALLRPQAPRLYSIASSPLAYEDEIHLTVATLAYKHHGQARLGAASGYLNRRLAEGEELEIYVAESPTFHLPEDGATPIVLIGAGTGIAPFRAFLQHRAARGDTGGSWLIFGNRHFHRDFLYQLDWLEQRKAGRLSRADVAFSRDGGNRRYVQHCIREQAREIRDWLEEGAWVYVCGAACLGDGVHQALIQALSDESGSNSTEAGAERLEALRAAGHYRRDLY